MKRAILSLVTLLAAAHICLAINRDPNGVNVNSQGATTVFITFGALNNQVPVEAFWCGELIPATPDIGSKCDPATIFGQLPLRFDQSTLSGSNAFTDIMSIPPSVARRAYQAAQEGKKSSFFYVRRFSSTVGGPDEYVFVTCRMAGGGARVPFSLLDVKLSFDKEINVLNLAQGERPPALQAEITYAGTGRLQGRWEIVTPGQEPPTERDLLTEATLPVQERPLQRRYSELERFNVFLPPTGKYTLHGPDITKIPKSVEGLYSILFRVEASDDKEADSSLDKAGAGTGVVHSGAVAGFPMPFLRYYVGGSSLSVVQGRLMQLLPEDQAILPAARAVDFSWVENIQAALFKLEVQDGSEQEILVALQQPGTGSYRAPSWLAGKVGDKPARWRVVALDPEGKESERTPWRSFRIQQ